MDQLDRKLPNWIQAFLHYTKDTEPPLLFRKWTAISCLASALQRKCYIDWGAGVIFNSNLYIVLVGPTATGKSSAMGPGLKIIKELPAIKLSAQATSLQALIRHLKDTNLTDHDLTTGKQSFHSSLTIFSKEFTVFLGYHNRELIAALCDWYDCDDHWTYDTIKRDKEEIIGVWVNLFGGTTPELIQSSLPIESISGGLAGRTIFVYEEKKGQLITRSVETDHQLFQLLVHDLEKVSLLSGKFEYTKGFEDLWEEWVIKADVNPPFHDTKFDGYVGRRRAHLMKLCMIISAAHGQHDLELTEEDLGIAIGLLKEVEVKMGNVFKGMGKGEMSELINKAIQFFVTSDSDEIPYWQFARHFKDDMDKMDMDRVMNTLEASKIVQVIQKPQADNIIKVLEHKDKIVKNFNSLEEER